MHPGSAIIPESLLQTQLTLNPNPILGHRGSRESVERKRIKTKRIKDEKININENNEMGLLVVRLLLKVYILITFDHIP